MLGRIHNYNEFEQVYSMARQVGFNNINVDLMIGLPKQTMEDVDNSLEKIIKKEPEHISVYSLIVEENTPIFNLIESGSLMLPDEEIERKMYWRVKCKLEEAGYKHYEISNFAKQNYKSKHNLNCWNQRPYLGIGAAAHSYYNKMRFSNIDDVKKYIENYKNKKEVCNIMLYEEQSNEDTMKEFMLLGLRKIDGVNINMFKNKFSQDPIYIYRRELKKLTDEGLIEIDDNSIRLSNKGIDLANQVWMEFV